MARGIDYLVVIGLTCVCASVCMAADWKPAKGPLMTRWAEDVSPDNAHPEYPRPQMVREQWQNLNGLWQLAFAEADEKPPVGKTLDERILVPFPVESALSGIMKHAERLWYRRTFTIPNDWDGKRVMLNFGAVDWEATVYVNGEKMGMHRGGYDAFSFDITDALKADGEQELIVGVFDPTTKGSQPRGKQVLKPGGIMYTPTTGIWQTAWLEPVSPAHIKSMVITPDIDSEAVEVSVKAQTSSGDTAIKLTVLDGGKVLRTAEVSIEHDEDRSIISPTVKLEMPDAKLWSPSDPFLYDLKITMESEDEVTDEIDSYFGMRKISLGKDDNGITRIMLNNEFVFQIGPLDQGFWPDGLYTAATDEALRYDVEVTKKLGFNMARKHVKIEPARWYYWCDKLGLLVWQDMASGNNKGAEARKQFQKELRGLVEGFRNHPSIIMWVVFNEGWGQHDTARLTNFVKKLDPTRLVSNASGWADKKVGDVHDIHSYPGPASPKPEDDRAAVLGEFGGLGLGIDGHTWTDKHWGYRGMKDKGELTDKYVNLMRGVWRFVDDPGLSAAVYTQTSDVETECNGLMTYDRDIIKMDIERVRQANSGDLPKLKVIVPTAQQKPGKWRYTTDKPDGEWFKAGYDDSGWKEGPAGFGKKGTPGSQVRTTWDTSDIWLRRKITMPKTKLEGAQLFVHHDEDCEVYINGVLALEEKGYTSSYETFPLNKKARKALKPGENIIAVHCKQTSGGQYIDVGIIAYEPRE